jgi:hypothetical protein
MDPRSVDTLVNCRLFSILAERSPELLDLQIDPGYPSRWFHSGRKSSHVD